MTGIGAAGQAAVRRLAALHATEKSLGPSRPGESARDRAQRRALEEAWDREAEARADRMVDEYE